MLNELRRPEVNVIPATKRSVESGGQIKKLKTLRVAAYCRVSTEDESQQTSYTTQKRFYMEMISNRPGWTLAGIYADEALTGTSRAKRKQFNTMMEDAVNGKMDYIVTKSISRFARNTVDTLDCVRQLRQLSPPIGIYFEKENIDTLDATGELILTILSALAQDESRSISDNIRWSIQKKFQRGEAMIDLKRFLGYDKGENGEWVINEEQAAIVRYIFDRYVCGINSNTIAKELNDKGIRTLRGSIWRSDSILRILKNEKYVGDLEMQKTITKNFLTHRASVNTGEAPKYYVENHHVGIIDRLTWDKVQLIFKEHGVKSSKADVEEKKKRGSKASPFTNLICGATRGGKPCGARLVRMCYNNKLSSYTDDRSIAAQGLDPAEYAEHYYYSYPVWRCSRNASGAYAKKDDPLVMERDGSCPSGCTYECALEQSFMEMLYKLKRDYEANGDTGYLAVKFRTACERIDSRNGMNSRSGQRMETLDLQIGDMEKQLSATMEKQAEAMRLATAKQDELLRQSCDDYVVLAADIRKSLEGLKRERAMLEAEQGTTAVVRKNYELFLKCLMQLPETNTAGMKLNVNGLDVEGSIFRDLDGKARPGKRSSVKSGHIRMTEERIAQAPDYLRFEKGIYIAFIKGGTVDGDMVLYKTNFGVELLSTGNTRNLSSFLGFRRANEDGTVDFLDECWKVRDRSVCYSRRKITKD